MKYPIPIPNNTVAGLYATIHQYGIMNSCTSRKGKHAFKIPVLYIMYQKCQFQISAVLRNPNATLK